MFVIFIFITELLSSFSLTRETQTIDHLLTMELMVSVASD